MRLLHKKKIFEQYKETEIEQGSRLDDIVLDFNYPEEIWDYTETRINGELIPREMWGHVIPHENAVVSITTVPAGGSIGSVNAVATLAVMVALGPAVFGLSAGWVAFGTIVTGLAMNMLFPPAKQDLLEKPDRTNLNAITGQANKADPYGVVIRNYGYNRIYPRTVAEPYTYYVGTDQYLISLLDFGIGNNFINDGTLTIGETSILDFPNIYRNKANTPDQFTIYTTKINTESFNVEFKEINDSAIKTSPESSESVEIQLLFPSGLAAITSGGAVIDQEVSLSIKIRETGTTTWTDYNKYDFDVDSIYEQSNRQSFQLAFKPTFTELVKTHNPTINGNYYNVADYKYYFYGDTFEYRVLDAPTNTNYANRETQKLVVGDKVYFAQEFGGFFLNLAATVISEESSNLPWTGYHKVKFDIPVSWSSVIRVGDTNEFTVDTPPWIYDTRGGGYNILINAVSTTPVFRIKRNNVSPFTVSMKINPALGPKQYDVWIVLQDEESSYNGVPVTIAAGVSSDFDWTAIKGHASSSPVKTSTVHTYLEIKAQAIGVGGVIDALSGEVNSYLDYYDDVVGIWKTKLTSNPAWVFVDILTGDLNQRAISKDDLDIDSLVKWAKFCETATITYQGNTIGFECNFVLDYNITIRNLLEQVCSTGRATLNINNGKYGVIIDELKTVPTQMFNQRNILSLNVQRDYTPIPHGIRATYIDPLSNWQKNEVIAYDDGFSLATAEIIEEIEMFGCTSIAQAWRQGRYFLAQQKLRRENLTIEVDFESLACSRGDLVYFSHDVMLQGGLPARVVSVINNGTFNFWVKLDEAVIDDGGSYILRARVRSTDTIIDLPVLSFIDSNTVKIAGPNGLQYDDLVVFGEASTVTSPYIVKEITNTSELTASISLIEQAPDIYTADSGPIPDYTVVTVANLLESASYPPPVENLVYDYQILCHSSEKKYVYSVTLNWDLPLNTSVNIYEVYVEFSGQTRLVGFSKNNSFEYIVSGLNIGKEHKFTVIPVNGLGGKASLGESTNIAFTPSDDTTPPSTVADFNANVLTEVIELDWKQNADCDIDRYFIRYSPKTIGATWYESVKLTSAASHQNNITVPLRTGTYFIKAVDWAGNISLQANRLVTYIPEILNTQVISSIVSPVFDGFHENTKIIGSDLLTLDSVDGNNTFSATEGNFYFRDIFDLGDIFTARFESSVVAIGFTGTSLMSSWTLLSLIDPISGGFTDADFDASTYIRTKNAGDTIVDWVTLSSIGFMSFGTEFDASPWTKFRNGDFTGRIFQLKIKLEGNDLQTISPMVISSDIKAHWVERIAEGRDEISNVAVTYNGAFNEIPALQITAKENISQGDYHVFTSETVEGFTVQFYDKDDNAVSNRKYDWIAKGIGKRYDINDLNF